MPHPVKEEVQGTLRDYHPRIRAVVERAWSEWRAMATWRVESGFAPFLYSRTVANIVFDAIARNAIAEFASDASVHVEIDPQTIKLFFKGAVLARFKKGNDNNLGQNIPTQAALAFEYAEALFPGMPPETAKVEFIWRANEINTRLEHVLAVARDGDRVLWDYEIEPSGEVVRFPEQPKVPVDPADEDLVTPKAPDTQQPSEKE